jgi:hypothetical protein
MFKLAARLLLCLTLMFSMLSAAIPLHNIFHNHHFVQLDNCGLNSCENHIKNHNDHCHTHSDAIFLAALPQQNIAFGSYQPIKKLTTFFKDDNYFQFFYLTKNKAPPLRIIA